MWWIGLGWSIMNAKTIGTMKKEFHLTSKKVRDGMIRTIITELCHEAFASPLIEHLKKIGYKKFDEFNEITLVLKSDNIRLHFSTTLMGGHTLTYTIDDYAMNPPNDMKKTTFLGIEY